VIVDALNAVVAALEAEGLRTSLRSGDITPPVCHLQIGQVAENGSVLVGGVVVTFYVHYIPVRGVDNLAGDADALDAVYRALAPMAVTDLVTVKTSVTVYNDTWPCYRSDLAAMALATAEV
jgi:hypothetical protein